MRLIITALFSGLFLIAAPSAFAKLKIGEIPPLVDLDKDNGERVDGKGKWSSSSINGKVLCLFYVDPDESDLNEELTEALKKADFPLDRYGSIAIINMAATWLPNFAISSKLESKQEAYPNTTYVKDYVKHLVTKWNLADDSYHVLIFAKDGKLLFDKAGKFTKKEIKTALDIIRQNI